MEIEPADQSVKLPDSEYECIDLDPHTVEDERTRRGSGERRGTER